MPIDAELGRIAALIQTELTGYRRKLEGFHFGKDATARLRTEQCVSLLEIIREAQVELAADFRPEDTNAQIDGIVRACSETSTFRSTLGGLAERVKAQLQTHRFKPQRRDIVAAQSAAWNMPRSVIDVVITDPNTGGRASRIDVQCALQFLGADGQYHPVDPGDDDYSDTVARMTLGEDRGLSSCHPTAEGLQAILGQTGGYFASAGGAGPGLRAEAIELALTALDAGAPARVIWLKCTATADGHSFTLIKKPSGTVEVLEAWANGGGNGYLLPLRAQLKHTVARDAAVEAVTRLNDPASDTRDLGYAALSTAYGDAAHHPAEHFEELNPDTHDSDANISILCTVRDLADYPTVQGRMQARYGVLTALRGRLGGG